MKRYISFLIAILIAIAILSPIYGTSSGAETRVKTVLEGPKEVLLGEKYTYTIKIEGAENADKWGYKIEMKDGSADPSNASSTESNVFKVNITAPSVEGDFKITINGTADIGNYTYWNKINYTITAVKPYIIKADVYNSGSVEAKNVSVSLYIDGKFQYKTSVDVAPQKKETVELKFNPHKFSDGVHDVKIVIDPKSNLTFSDGGKTEMTMQIYLGEMHEDHTGTWIALAILFGAGAVYSLISYRKKKKRMKRRKW